MKLESRRGEVKESFDALKVALMAQEKELMDHLDSESKAFDLNKKLVSLKFLAECISKAEPSSEISERDGELAATRFDQVHFIPRTIPISQTLGRFYRIRHCKSHPLSDLDVKRCVQVALSGNQAESTVGKYDSSDRLR